MLAALLGVLLAAPPAPELAYDPLVTEALAQTRSVYPVPRALVFAVMRQESSFYARARSPAGALGLMQVMPYTALKVDIDPEELLDPRTNILAGVRLLAVLLRYYKGDVISTLIAYNARPRELFAPIPANGETPGYCARVLAYFKTYLEVFPPLPPLPSPDAGSSEPVDASSVEAGR